MSNATKQFQITVIRHLKGILTQLEDKETREQLIIQIKGSLAAWEEWLKTQ
jgi:hypothetical protein